MRKLTLIVLFTNAVLLAQSYPPAANETGTSAIAADSPIFTSWATGIEVTRGFIDVSNTSAEDNDSNYASFGNPEDALGPATNSAVSLGDAGEAILSFNIPISNGPGFDFAVFENSFSDTFLELAFVEVSSDGINYFRFPSHSQTQTDTQIDGFGNVDPTYINNLAGKYRALFGTPFDISEIQENSLLDKNSITHIKIIDVVGSIDPMYASIDSFGNAINDPFNTPFFSGGFDLDAVGVINEQVLDIDDKEISILSMYPNPVSDILNIHTTNAMDFQIYDVQGHVVFSAFNKATETIDVSAFAKGMYILTANYKGVTLQQKFIKE
ncbi:T9SS type A sorting domain-containing protein [Patiriisocius marinus]|uniref:T9SS type A sorting domain-containing protein n=1 Tax=Patiriisocius marinus TaxID=1397112 RepID=UPI00232D3050|nr:T9SS type A sorting domain-containing protein [Patiriisocius marinus]